MAGCIGAAALSWLHPASGKQEAAGTLDHPGGPARLKSPKYEQNAAIISSNSTDLLNFLGITLEEATIKGIRVHNMCQYESRFKSQLSRDTFSQTDLFLRESFSKRNALF
jgi:hypothetical protein